MADTEPAASPEEILTRRRIGAALGALIDPSRDSADDALHLSEDERRTIRQALTESLHPLAGFAHNLLDQWADLAADDRVAGLVLVAEITRRPAPTRSRNLDYPAGPGLSR